MPIFEYKCAKCGKEFEEIVLGGKDDVKCPECGSDKTEKLMSQCRHRHGGFGPGFADGPSTGPNPGSSACAGCTGGDCSSCGS